MPQDWSNQSTREMIEPYPVITKGPISEWYHGNKLLNEIDPDLLSPMYDAGEVHYYVKEFSLHRAEDGLETLIIPVRWVKYDGKVHAQARRVATQPHVRLSSMLDHYDDSSLPE